LQIAFLKKKIPPSYYRGFRGKSLQFRENLCLDLQDFFANVRLQDGAHTEAFRLQLGEGDREGAHVSVLVGQFSLHINKKINQSQTQLV
jgi:hypothetical protein